MFRRRIPVRAVLWLGSLLFTSTTFAAVRPLLIVAPENLHDALKSYIEYKRSILPTDFVSLETVLRSTPGVDDPERLKRFLYERRHSSDGIGAALLVGDCRIMPVRYMVLDRITPAAFDCAFYPSDLYYADLARDDGSFDDWNAARDGFHAGYFGEVHGEKNKSDPINYDHIHYRPQLAVGRWPVFTAEQTRIVAGKSMRYERSVRDGTHPGLRTACVFHVQGWIDARGTLSRLALPDWTNRDFFFQDSRHPQYRTPAPTEENLVSALNAGCTLCVHAGHGGEESWLGWPFRVNGKINDVLDTRHTLALLHNADRLPIMMSVGCSTNYFAPLPPYEAYTDVHGVTHRGTDHGEVFTAPPPPPSPYQRIRLAHVGLGEQLLRDGPDGAVAYIGCNTGSQPCAITLLDGFLKAAASSPEPRLGDCWNRAVDDYYVKERLATLKPDSGWYPPSIFFQAMKYMLFGDPTLPLPPKSNGA